MNRILFIVVLIALLISVPVAIKYSSDAKRLQNDLTAQMEASSVVSTELSKVSDSLKNKTEQIMALTNDLDNMSRLYDNSLNSANQLSAKVAKISVEIDSLKTLAQERLLQFQEQDNVLSGIRVQLADTTKTLIETRDRLDSRSALVKERTALISQLQPWYGKWKHDATERNWLEKLFGADKAKLPDFPEPAFLTIPADSGGY